MTIKTKIVNGTSIPLVLKEGNTNVYRDICVLAPKPENGEPPADNHHIVALDPNATDRDYLIVGGHKDEKVSLNSDDFYSHSTITIVKDEMSEKYRWEGNIREDSLRLPHHHSHHGSDPTKRETTGAKHPKFFLGRVKSGKQ